MASLGATNVQRNNIAALLDKNLKTWRQRVGLEY